MPFNCIPTGLGRSHIWLHYAIAFFYLLGNGKSLYTIGVTFLECHDDFYQYVYMRSATLVWLQGSFSIMFDGLCIIMWRGYL